MSNKKQIFVYGSNTAGRHGRGSALEAVQHWGAIYGCGIGLCGQSWAIPTKDGNLNVLDIKIIKKYVDEFIEFARNNPDTEFLVVKIGCGLAGFSNEEMAPLFKEAYKLNNVKLHQEWRDILFINSLEEASDKISGFPEWKQNILKR